MVTTLHDLVYASTPQRDVTLDLYVPDDGAPQHPLFIYLHGGGWKVGDKRDDVEGRMLPLVARGFVVASASYRLSGDALHPAAVHDVKAAVRWLRANASEYRIDPSRIGLGGASAGGHLASLAALSNGDPELEGIVGEHLDQSSSVGAVVAWYPPTDLVMSSFRSPFEARNLPEPSASGYLRLETVASDDRDLVLRAASPRWRAHRDAPPHLLLHGDRDAVVPLEHSRALHDALVGLGATSALHVVGGAGHEDPALETPSVMALIAGFLDEHLTPFPTQESPGGSAVTAPDS
ncbi:alpha/beta hydrolase [Salinibacterium sp. dk2585]|uniref:alpha/beta hydrolase n=1 Tax=unclassified Salinibacterium TaxID=2632331 RepID=UPI0011C24BF8|nr:MULTISPECIES: alpha/beta hydrolase [unclassified Salinibacterium]QEE60277.1 alpha/beta hydrolase [Salinibacterium sp. dk2585]TXK55349.1 alpha/beta hydrolase [Salinibacterium sp. dk5596]